MAVPRLTKILLTMKTNARIEDEVDRTLRSIDGIERASPRPFFSTRVEARLRQRGATKPLAGWVFRPAWVVASLGLVLALNLSAVFYVRQQMAQHEQEQETVGLSAEWGFDANGLDW